MVRMSMPCTYIRCLMYVSSLLLDSLLLGGGSFYNRILGFLKFLLFFLNAW